MIDKCAFDRNGCEEGLDGLLAWEFEWNEELNVFSREPLHNWASHPGDGFAYGCQVMRDYESPPKSAEKPRFLHETTVDELFYPERSKKARDRI